MSSSRFSVVMPAFNAEAYIRDALRTVAMAQGGELLDYVFVVDDASTDRTASEAKAAFSDFCLPGVVLPNARNLGVGESRRYAIDAVESPIVMCVDADDLLRRDRFVAALDKLSDPSVVLVGGDVLPFDDEGGQRAHRRILFPTVGADIAAATLFFNPIWSGVCAFRRSALEAVPLPLNRIGEDWLFAHRVIQAFGPGAVANTGTVLIDHRRYATQVTRNSHSDSSDVYGVWAEILAEAIGLQAGQAELALHAKFSPYHFAPTAIPAGAEMELWLAWVDKILDHAVAADYVPLAVSRQIHKINAVLMQSALRRVELPA